MKDIIFYLDSHICFLFSIFGIRAQWMNYNQMIMRFVHRTSKGLHPEEYVSDEKQVGKIVNKIWIFWAQGYERMPQSVRKCYESVLSNRGQNDVILLDMNNYSQYVNIPEHIECKMRDGSITFTHFSDILRFTLLRDYGGYWIDATIFVTQPIDVCDHLFTIKNVHMPQYISEGFWCVFFWYMPQGYPLSNFVCDYLYSYWEKQDTLIEYLLVDFVIREFYNKNRKFRVDIENLKSNNPDLYFFQSETSERVFDKYEWEKICKRTQFFKTTWKTEKKREVGGVLTFWGQLL